MTAPSQCDLCEAARFTHWYFEDNICWVADCEVCCVPMVVWKQHRLDPTDDMIGHMLSALRSAATSRFGGDEFRIDHDMRSIPDHWHAHARDPEWFALRSDRPLSRFTTVAGPRVER